MRALRGLCPATIVLAVLGGALVGCGTGDDRAEVRAAVERFYRAVERDDGRLACAQLSPDLRASLSKSREGRGCRRAIRTLALKGGRPAAIRVYATSAQVDLDGGDTVFLGHSRLGWRIDAVGCRPKDGGPYDCEETG